MASSSLHAVNALRPAPRPHVSHPSATQATGRSFCPSTTQAIAVPQWTMQSQSSLSPQRAVRRCSGIALTRPVVSSFEVFRGRTCRRDQSSSSRSGSQCSVKARNGAAGEESQPQLAEIRHLPFSERLKRAWNLLFPPAPRPSNNADIAKERLRLVLYTDRGEVSPEVRRSLRRHIIAAISAYVVIEDEEEVQLSVAADPDLGAVYSVTIPVRRVKPEFQEYWSDSGFRDRFYEQILREKGRGTLRFSVSTTMLGPGER